MKKKANLWIGILALMLILTSAVGGELSERYKTINTNLISPVPNGFLVSVRAETSGLVVTPIPTPSVKDTTEELISFYSQKYAISEQLVSCIITMESNYKHLAVGDNGASVGMAQFKIATWQSFRKQMGLSQKDERTDKAESIGTLTWALSRGLGRHWSVYRGCLK